MFNHSLRYVAILILIISPSLFGQKKIKAITSFTIIADIAKNVAGDKAIVESITKPGAEIHNYQTTPRDVIKARGADIIFWNGLNLELWFERFLQDSKNSHSVVVSKGVKPLSIYEGKYSGKPNPHAWMSVANGLIYVENIRQAFVEIDPKNAKSYNQNAKAYAQKLQLLQQKIKDSLAFIPTKKRYLATSEGAFSYLAKEMNMQEVYLWPINADQQGSPKQVKQIIDKVRKFDIPVIFSESTISDKPAKQVALETKAIYGGVLYVDSLSKPDDKVPTYLDLLQVTSSQIAKGFRLALDR